MIIFSVLLSRGAILDGVSSEGSYNLSDYNIQKIEAAQTPADARKAGEEMYLTYLKRIQAARKASGSSALVRSVLEYIETHIFEKIRLEAMAEKTGYSQYYLSRKFKEETGKSISETIHLRKTEKAKQLLADSHLSVSEIGERLCFSSPSHFYNVFKKLEKVSPQEYRNRR